jgi:hypothetical protein
MTMAWTDSNDRDSRRDDAVDELIRRRFRNCRTLPLFSDQPAQRRGFFEASPIGPQRWMFDSRRRAVADTPIARSLD